MASTVNSELVVRYHHLNETLRFSALSQIQPPKKAFETFVKEMFTALTLAKELRRLSESAIVEDEKRKIDDLLCEVLQAIGKGYYPNRDYSLECADVYDNAQRNRRENLSETIKAKISFEKCLGPVVRELGDPLTSLKGYSELIQRHTPSDDKKQEMLTVIDKQIEQILKILKLCQKHLAGEINIWKCTPEETQTLLNTINTTVL